MISPEPTTMWEALLAGSASLIAAMSAIIFYSFRAKILQNESNNKINEARIAVLEKELLVVRASGTIYLEQSTKDHVALDKTMTLIFEEIKAIRREMKT